MIKLLLISLLIGNPGWSTRTSEHFTVKYQSVDKQVVTDVIVLLEKHIDRVSIEVGADLTHPVSVYIHPDRHSLLQASGMNFASPWLVGVAINDREIHLISPLNPPGNHSFESVMDGLVHELVHVCVANAVSEPLPLWFNEGLAVYFAGQYRFAQEVPGLVREKVFLPELDDLAETDYFEKNHGYALSYTIVEYILKRNGKAGLKHLIQEYPSFSSLGLLSQMSFEQEWHQYLKEHYGNPPPLPEWQDSNNDIFQATLTPNPVRDFAKLEFFATSDDEFALRVLDPWGNRMQTLFHRPISTGFHAFRIDASSFPAGIFYIELEQGKNRQLIRFTK